MAPRRLRESLRLRRWVSTQFLGTLLSTPRGRAFVLTQAGIAETTDEGAIFAALATKVDDQELRRLVRRHAADEERHAAIFLDAAARQGAPCPKIPDDVQVLPMLDARVGVFGRPLSTQEDVMDAYLVLQVIEERAVEQFSIIEPVLRRYDPRSADDLRGIAKDEERHLLYCHAITKRYAPSEARRVARLEELREAEALAFRDHQQKGFQFVLEQKLLPARSTFFWATTIRLLEGRTALPYTRSHHAFGHDVALAA